MSAWARVILHADMDAFYAAVEQHDRPELRGKPVIVGHPGRRGVVATASYEARPFGVHSAMPMAVARRRCPQGIVVPPRFSRYQDVSRVIMKVFGSFSPLVEALSLDEAFIDMTGAERLFGSPREMGQKLKRAVYDAVGLRVSVGVATTKFVAKVASDFDKPDGLTIVPPDDVQAFLGPQPVTRLWGVGPKAAKRLEALQLHTIASVARAPKAYLEGKLGTLGAHIYALARGEDPRPVESEHQAQSIGHEETLAYDIRGPEAARPILLRAADVVAARLRSEQLQAAAVRVKLKSASFRLLTRQRRLPRATDSAGPLYDVALALLTEFPWDEPLRLVGLAAYRLGSSTPRQEELFLDPQRERAARLDRAVDALRERFGPLALKRASEVDNS